jgi:hypothetical protein
MHKLTLENIRANVAAFIGTLGYAVHRIYLFYTSLRLLVSERGEFSRVSLAARSLYVRGSEGKRQPPAGFNVLDG